MITIMIMCFGFDRNTRVHTQMHTLNKQKSKYQIPYVEWWSNHKMHKFGYYTQYGIRRLIMTACCGNEYQVNRWVFEAFYDLCTSADFSLFMKMF